MAKQEPRDEVIRAARALVELPVGDRMMALCIACNLSEIEAIVERLNKFLGGDEAQTYKRRQRVIDELLTPPAD
jgi:hypothetical protein